VPTLTPTLARRLAVSRQRLAGARPKAGSDGLLNVLRDMNCVQLDPISAVAPSHLLVLWSRLGSYDPANLEALLWKERRLFEYWAHAASIVLTENYPIHHYMMRTHTFRPKIRKWLAANEKFRQYILDRLRDAGPLTSQEIEDRAQVPWRSTGWTTERNVGMMLDILWTQGRVMVAGRKGRTRSWHLTERHVPNWAPRDPLSETEMVRQAAQKSLRALGVARPRDIRQHFIRGYYPNLEKVLADLAAEGKIIQVQVAADGTTWPERWYVHKQDLPLLDSLADGQWQPQTRLLSPFDNLICDRRRTEDLFDFHFRLEIYTPKPKRRYGYYVLPILHGDRLIGRLDPKFDRKSGRLTINAVYAEPDAPMTKEVGQAIAGALQDLSQFIGAKEIDYARPVPSGWRTGLR
jgi:uncharacterized protein